MSKKTHHPETTKEFDSMPDVASESVSLIPGPLESVGMSGMEVPVTWAASNGEEWRLSARVDASVNLLQAQARGIHMSRLFKEVQSGIVGRPLTLQLLGEVTDNFLRSHEGLSDRASLAVSFSALLERQALKSANSGWRSYPVTLGVNRNLTQGARFFVEVLVTYSSTCPASAALARQLDQQNFKQHFAVRVQPSGMVSASEVEHWLGRADGVHATPHAQRSFARVRVVPKDFNFDFVELIDLLEKTLQTPVQTVVKREDEQEFARRNGENLMFCEDAARRVQRVLQQRPEIIDFTGEFRHVESLHPHDAVAKISKYSGSF